MTEVEQQPLPQNGIDLSAAEEDDNSKSRPADIEQDMREMERRKRVEAIMSSKLFREELERIVDSARESGTTGIIQQLSDIVGIPMSRVGSMFRASSCLLPINDIRGVESMGYAKGEKILRCKLAATFRLLDLYGWTEGLGAQVTARLKVDQEYFLVNPYGLLYNEITASALNKVDMQGQIVEQGTTNFGINRNHFTLHSVVHAARPDIRCAIYIGCNPVVAISSLKTGLLPITKDACVLGEITTYNYTGYLYDEEERNKLVRNLGPNSKVMLLSNHGALCCGETIEEAFFAACHIVRTCETQLKLLPIDVDKLILIPEETRKMIYDHARRPPEDLDKRQVISSTTEAKADDEDTAKSPTKIVTTTPKWRVGGAEFEALMRMLDNAGFRTGYIYRHPLVKSEPPKPKNDVELPPAVSSLGYLLEEEELFRQGIWKRGDLRKGGDRSRWLNSPNVYQKVEVLETGTPDPKKITKWVAEGSPTHSTPVRIEDPLQFVPVNTNPREFKRVQQQIKDNRRADKISAGPQSHILEGVTWDEANRIKDANVSTSSDHVVLVGAASKGIIQRGFQHNATVYKAPYAKNPFDCVTDDELNEYKRTVERKKKSIYGEYTDTDFSESEALSSQQTSGAQQPQIKEMTTKTTTTTTAAISQSEPEDISEHQVMRIQTQQAPVRSQPEVVLSDATMSFINGERSHTAKMRKPPTGQDIQDTDILEYNQESNQCFVIRTQDFKSNKVNNKNNSNNNNNKEKNNNKNKNNNTSHYYWPLEMDGTNKHQSQKSQPQSQSQPQPQSSQRHQYNPNQNQALINELKDDSLLFKRQRERHSMPYNKANNEPRQYNTGQLFHNVEKSTNNDNEPNNLPYKTLNNENIRISANANAIANANANSKTNAKTSGFESRIGDFDVELYDDIYSYTKNSLNDNVPHCISAMSANSDEYVYDYIDAKNVYKKSRYCCTPNICAAILGSMGKDSQNLRNDTNTQTTNDLIWNIPFYQEVSHSNTPLSTPEKQPIDVRQSRIDFSPKRFKVRYSRHVRTKSQSPYRTLSHFGFNSPQRDPQPDHKHIPLTDDLKKYVPLRRSASYEELFASSRFLEICEHCFEKLVRLKPELVQNRDITEVVPSSPPSGYLKSYKRSTGIGNKSPSNIVRPPLNEDVLEEHMEDNNHVEIALMKSFNLEPLIETEERECSDGFLSAKTGKSSIQKQPSPRNISKDIVDSRAFPPIQDHTIQFRSENMNLCDIAEKNTKKGNCNHELRCLQLDGNSNTKNKIENCPSIAQILEVNNSLNGDDVGVENVTDFTTATERNTKQERCKGITSVMVQTDVPDMVDTETNTSLDDTNSDEQWDVTITAAEEQSSEQEWPQESVGVIDQSEYIERINKIQSILRCTESTIFLDDSSGIITREQNSEQEWHNRINSVMEQTDILDMANTEFNAFMDDNNSDAEWEPTITVAGQRYSGKESPQELVSVTEQTEPIDMVNKVQLISRECNSNCTEPNSCFDRYGSKGEKEASFNTSVEEDTGTEWPTDMACVVIRTKPVVDMAQSISGTYQSPDSSRRTESSSSSDEQSGCAEWIDSCTTILNKNSKQESPEGITYDIVKSSSRSCMDRRERARRTMEFRQFLQNELIRCRERDPSNNNNSCKTSESDVDTELDAQRQNFKFVSPLSTSTGSSLKDCESVVDEVQDTEKVMQQQNFKVTPPSSMSTDSSYKDAESVDDDVQYKQANEQQQSIKLTSPSPTSTDVSYNNVASVGNEVQDTQENEQRENFEFAFPSSPMSTDGQKGYEMEIFLDAETFYGCSVIEQPLSPKNQMADEEGMSAAECSFGTTPSSASNNDLTYSNSSISDNKNVKIVTDDDDLHNTCSLSGATSTLDYKDSCENFPIHSQSTDNVKKLLSSTHVEDMANCCSSNLTTEFESTTSDDYESDSNMSRNCKVMLKEIQSSPAFVSPGNIQARCNSTNADNVLLDDDLHKNFSPIERTILEKIQMNQLNKSDEIFDKIENTIRNRRVSPKLDMVIIDKVNCASPTQTESEDTPKHCNQVLNDCYRSRSLTVLKDNAVLATASNSTLLLKNATCLIQNIKKSSSQTKTGNCSTTNNQGPALSKNRNFILENIRNASRPSRHINDSSIKRKSAGCSLADLASSNTSLPTKSVKPIKSIEPLKMYTFESKSIRGSPKFWVSLSNSPRNSSYSHEQYKQHKEAHLKEIDNNNNNTKGKINKIQSSTAMATATASQVNAEISALGEEIHDMQPHVDNHTHKVENFGNRISKYTRGSAKQK